MPGLWVSHAASPGLKEGQHGGGGGGGESGEGVAGVGP